MSQCKSWFEISLSFKWKDETRRRIYKKTTMTTKERNKQVALIFREKRNDLVHWGIRTKHRTKTVAEKEFQRIPKRYRKQYVICETCSIPELDALFM